MLLTRYCNEWMPRTDVLTANSLLVQLDLYGYHGLRKIVTVNQFRSRSFFDESGAGTSKFSNTILSHRMPLLVGAARYHHQDMMRFTPKVKNVVRGPKTSNVGLQAISPAKRRRFKFWCHHHMVHRGKGVQEIVILTCWEVSPFRASKNGWAPAVGHDSSGKMDVVFLPSCKRTAPRHSILDALRPQNPNSPNTKNNLIHTCSSAEELLY